MEKKKRISRNSIPRLVFVGVSVALQVGWILLLALRLNAYSTYISLLTSLLALILVVRLQSRETGTALKLPWIMLILALPVMGLSLYLMIEIFGDLGKTGKRLRGIQTSTRIALPENRHLQDELGKSNPSAANLSRYLLRFGHAPLCTNTKVTYHPEAKDALHQLKEDLKRAKHFIYMEYFIVEDGEAFAQIREILAERAAAGVDVRLMYDDIGSIGYANFHFAWSLTKQGIRCRVFNPALPVLNLFMNHRDHRKITVIDGYIGYTGGYNLADAYFDITRPYGKWKDTGIRLEGEAVRSLTASFLELWHTGSLKAAVPVLPEYPIPAAAAEGFVQPFADSPLGKERLAENVYLNLAFMAEKELWFITPYLIITDEMIRALGLAAKRGVDVRIITPGIPDKKMVYQVTRSYYAGLVGQGVRIYEYVPGFCHAKQCLCDGKIASIGTSNLDYRSLYHHFENNVVLYGGPAVEDIRRDFAELYSQCAEVTETYRTGRKAVLRTWQCLLRLIAPLM